MIIQTPEFLRAEFFMRDETPPLSDISPRQVHGKNIIVVDSENLSRYALPERPEADGVLLTTKNISASLRFADCAPVMIYGSEWVMLLHSGYKGTVLNISGYGLELVNNAMGAWVGPCIGREYCRDINDEWTQKGMKAFHRENYDVNGGKVYFDLAGEIRSQLVVAGLAEENITLSGINTLTSPECYSYRRGDIKERMTLHVTLC